MTPFVYICCCRLRCCLVATGGGAALHDLCVCAGPQEHALELMSLLREKSAADVLACFQWLRLMKRQCVAFFLDLTLSPAAAPAFFSVTSSTPPHQPHPCCCCEALPQQATPSHSLGINCAATTLSAECGRARCPLSLPRDFLYTHAPPACRRSGIGPADTHACPHLQYPKKPTRPTKPYTNRWASPPEDCPQLNPLTHPFL